MSSVRMEYTWRERPMPTWHTRYWKLPMAEMLATLPLVALDPQRGKSPTRLSQYRVPVQPSKPAYKGQCARPDGCMVYRKKELRVRTGAVGLCAAPGGWAGPAEDPLQATAGAGSSEGGDGDWWIVVQPEWLISLSLLLLQLLLYLTYYNGMCFFLSFFILYFFPVFPVLLYLISFRLFMATHGKINGEFSFLVLRKLHAELVLVFCFLLFLSSLIPYNRLQLRKSQLSMYYHCYYYKLTIATTVLLLLCVMLVFFTCLWETLTTSPAGRFIFIFFTQ